MPSHDWSEENFDWKGLNEAIELIYEHCWKLGRFSGQAKEKFGQCRFYAQFGLSLHKLMFPKYCYRYHDLFCKYKWLIDFDNCIFTPTMSKVGLVKLWAIWQKKVYSDAYWKAINKYPHLRGEILCAADYVEFIKGVTRQEETETEKLTHVLGWDGEVVSTWRSSK